jgi:hypothetical protein
MADDFTCTGQYPTISNSFRTGRSSLTLIVVEHSLDFAADVML